MGGVRRKEGLEGRRVGRVRRKEGLEGRRG